MTEDPGLNPARDTNVYYLKYFATLITQNIPKDSHYCFDSLAIRLQCKDLKHLIPGTGPPGLQG